MNPLFIYLGIMFALQAFLTWRTARILLDVLHRIEERMEELEKELTGK